MPCRRCLGQPLAFCCGHSAAGSMPCAVLVPSHGLVSQASRVRGKPSRRCCARRSLSLSASPVGVQQRTRCATPWRQSTPPPASLPRAGRYHGTLTGWHGRPASSRIQPATLRGLGGMVSCDPVFRDCSHVCAAGCWVQAATLRSRGRVSRGAQSCNLVYPSCNPIYRGSSTCLARRSSARVVTPRCIASGRGSCGRASRGECSGRRR